jgi:predicted N-formylglutamate amidohydrolase
LTCEHASAALPQRYGTLGLARCDLEEHIGWDIGAARVMREVAERLRAPAVASQWSRLLVDVNRAPEDATLIVEVSDGIAIPGNRKLSAREREHRLKAFHAPYHRAVDRMIERARQRARPDALRLLSVHSFTPVMRGRTRAFDLGVLFDAYVPLARALARELRGLGYRVRSNEPYSGRAGLIYSARRHGQANQIPYVELEINNALIRTMHGARRVGRDVARALSRIR